MVNVTDEQMIKLKKLVRLLPDLKTILNGFQRLNEIDDDDFKKYLMSIIIDRIEDEVEAAMFSYQFNSQFLKSLMIKNSTGKKTTEEQVKLALDQND